MYTIKNNILNLILISINWHFTICYDDKKRMCCYSFDIW